MNISAQGLQLITFFEGLSLTPYQDQAGVWTIGYGHTGPDVTAQSPPITEAQAVALLGTDLATTANYVNQAANPFTQFQFDAMVSLAYNIGTAGFKGSSVLRFHNLSDRNNAIAAFLLWDKTHIDGVLTPDPGLLNRRIAEAALYSGAFNLPPGGP